jgi:hypothetical protein
MNPSGRGGGHGRQPAAASAPADGLELALAQGRSPTASAAFTPEVPPTRAMLGAGPGVDWPLAAVGVDAQHAEIAWDGATLWIRDAGSARGTLVDGQAIAESDWYALRGGEEVRLGAAVFRVRPAGSEAPGASLPEEQFDDSATMVTKGAAAKPSAHALPRAPSTAQHAASLDDGDPPSESTVIVQNPYAEPAAPASSALPPLAGRSAARAGGGVPLPRVTGSHATVPSRNAPVAPAPAPYDGARSDEATMAISLQDGAPVPAAFLARPAPAAAPAAAPFAPAPAAAPFAAAPAASPFGQLPTVPGSFEGGAFPAAAPQGEMTGLFGSIPPPPAPPPKPTAKSALAALPMRTRILFGVTLAAALGWLALDSGESPPPPAAPPPPPAVARPVPVFTPPIPGPAAGPTGTLLAASSYTPPEPVDPRTPPPPPPPPTSLPQRLAADAVLNGRSREALPLYEALAVSHTETPVYAHIATILRRRLEAQQAQQPCVPGGPTPCAPQAPAPAPPR